jgi:hypothetical protein
MSIKPQMGQPQSPLYLTTLEVIAYILFRLWLVIGVLMANNILDALMYNETNPTFKTELTPEMLKNLSPRQLETISSIQTANQALGKSGLSDVSDFMTNLAMTESNIGGDKEWGGSYSPFQIDPIGYEDIVSKGKAGEGQTLKRANMANELLQNMGYGKNFDILNLSLDEIREPIIGALLTRMKLGTIPEKIPTDLEGQANYWKKYWNTYAGKGTSQHFIGQVQDYNRKLNSKTYDDTPLEENKNPLDIIMDFIGKPLKP